MFPTSRFASSATVPEPVRPLAQPPVSVRPVPAASTPRPAARIPAALGQRLCRSPLPFGTFPSLRIKAFYRFRRQPVRLANAPDFLSLPGLVSIPSFETGSPFLVRYAFAGWLFLKPLGTFPNMLSLA
jgi:hypothetical protein